MFMLPQVLTTLPQTGDMWKTAELEGISTTFAILPNTAGVVVLRNADISLTSPTSLNGYVPKNNKLPLNGDTICLNSVTADSVFSLLT